MRHTYLPSVDRGPSATDTLIFKNLVRPFGITDVDILRLVMAFSGAIISGSTALAAVDPGKFTPNDLDFYLPATGLSSFLLYLHEIGYVHRRLSIAEETSTYPYQGALKLHKVYSLVHTTIGKSVHVVVTKATNPIATVLDFHSTLVMNYIAWYGVVSLYNPLTKLGIGLILTLGDKEKTCFEKYEDRGYTFRHEVPEDITLSRVRQLSDEFSSFKPFDNIPPTVEHLEYPITWTTFSH